MSILFHIFLFFLGACIGSYLCCQARRLRLKEQKKKPLGQRSVCMSCHHQLKWHDNLPIISWLALKGKCRHCHKKIGNAELLSELGTALSFVLLSFSINISTASSMDWTIFVATLLLSSILIFLAIYDGLYGELPTVCLALAIGCSIAILLFRIYITVSFNGFTMELIWKPALSFAILGGIYLILYLVPKGRWVGDGDWLLGTAIGIALYEPWLALIALFLANFIACVIMYPTVKSKKNHKIHFGPFLVISYIITASFANLIMSMI
ncbi:prepilin peptidase [Candidatus Saccharibacteria bacterium]|nr:prepilin peptidase [Candidatus Saccharibacteria bacterium]